MSKGKSLVESDIPGASLEGRAPENLKVKELQRWLLCRGASIKGKKADLIARLVQIIVAAAGSLRTVATVRGGTSSAPELAYVYITKNS